MVIYIKNKFRDFRYYIYDIKYGIENLIKYFKLIWKDRDWDYTFWLKMNRLKLSRMEKLIREHGIHLSKDRDANNINKAILAIDRLLADNYHISAFKKHDKKWGKLNISWKETDEFDEFDEMIFDRKNITVENEEQERSEFLKCVKHEEYLKTQDLKYLTEIVNKYLFTWWD